jgi:HD-GYP domain-containing protein (c-di-GMP phosphodiesterase class II)
MHDVGKVAIPDSILLKNGSLDPGERVLVERHSPIGFDILSGSTSPLLELAAEIALTHHEKVDGSGYPKGLKGEEIPIAGRIVAVADVYDALTSDRPYRPAIPAAEAVQMMVAERGTHFDVNLLDLFLERLDDVTAVQRKFADRDHGVALA